MVLYFVCPFTLAIVPCGPSGKGFKIKKAKAWVAKNAGVISAGVFMLRVALFAGRCVGVPLPQVAAEDLMPGSAAAASAIAQQIEHIGQLASEMGLDVPSEPDCKQLCDD